MTCHEIYQNSGFGGGKTYMRTNTVSTDANAHKNHPAMRVLL